MFMRNALDIKVKDSVSLNQFHDVKNCILGCNIKDHVIQIRLNPPSLSSAQIF
jgi:hypothetical protein